jgi:two-component system sensor histidine kinase QseC
MLGKFWRAITTPSLTRRLMLSQLALMVAIWAVLVFLIIQDIAYTDKWYQPRLMNNRATMILAVTEALHDRPVEQHTALARIDEFQRNEHREEDSTGLKVTMLVFMGDELVYASPGERRRVHTTTPFVIEHSVQDGRRFRTYMQSSVVSNARVILLLPADPEAVFIALWSRGFLLLPIVITLPILLLPAWISVWLALNPFRRVAEEVAAKGPEDLAPLTYKPKHRELLQMGKSVNGLLERIRGGVERERRFIADAAHELRTPLAAMRINVEALRQRPHDPSDEPLLDGLVHSGDRATRLVSQLLSLMRSDADPSTTDLQALRLDELAQERLAALGGIARQRELELELDAPAAVTITGERQGLITLIDNLIENAIKYSPPGSSVVMRVTGGSAGAARLTVEDAGPGIPFELRERVFERFYRAPDQTQSGSGLGLAIVRAVAEMHHATVSLGEPDGHTGLEVSVTFNSPQPPLVPGRGSS